MVEGVNRGFENHRQIKRQETEDEQRRKMQDMQMQNQQLQMDSTRQRMSANEADMEWTAGQRERTTRQQADQDANLALYDEFMPLARNFVRSGDASSLAPFYAQKVLQLEEGDWTYQPPAEEGGEGFIELAGGSRIPLTFESVTEDMLPGKQWVDQMLQARKTLAEQKAEAARAQNEADRKDQTSLRDAAIKAGSVVPELGDDGRYGVRSVPEGERRPEVDPSSRHADVLAYAEAKGIDKGLAWDIILGRVNDPSSAISSIADTLIKLDQYKYQGNPQAAFDEAKGIYERLRGDQPNPGYGVSGAAGTGSPAGGAGLPQNPQRRQAMLRSVSEQIEQEGEDAARAELQADGFNADAVIQEALRGR
jgi:hypothetical protein